VRRAIVVVLLVAIAAACSGGDDDDASSATTSTSAASTTTTTTGEIDLTALPLGDSHVLRDETAVGSLDLCSTFPTNGGGAQVDGDWIHGDTFDITAKLVVRGDVAWSNATFDAAVTDEERVLTGNLLPVDHNTGEFPIAADDPAYVVDRNPSGIVANDYEISLPAEPVEADAPGCVGGEVGFLLSGVVMNSPVDALGRDAVAHEVQDRCEGHPNNAGYHYHSVSTCIPDEGSGHSALVGYALDGYGIFGLRGEDGKDLTNDDLDECHGHTHEIPWDGTTRSMYHYHATHEFPYAVGCFHGVNGFQGPVLGAQH
jgi:hypothetical protein